MRFAVSTMLLVTLALPAFAQQAPRALEEKIDVSAVLIDAIVTDRNGKQILGLTKDDFIVRENGEVRQLDSVDYYTNLQLLDRREESAPFKVEQVREERYFIFFFDKPEQVAALWDQLSLARNAVRSFIADEMAPGDLIAIVGHDVRLKVYSDFTSDRATLERALVKATQFGPGITRAGSDSPSILRNIASRDMIGSTGTVYQALDLLGDALRPIRGRKNVILFSPGIRDIGEAVMGDMLVSRSRHFDPMIESLNASNVSVYGVQLQRDVDSIPVVHQRLQDISSATGGDYTRFSVSFKPTLDRIEDQNNGYYLLTYQSQHPRGERGFQKVDVALKNPEFKVTARAGYMFGE